MLPERQVYSALQCGRFCQSVRDLVLAAGSRTAVAKAGELTCSKWRSESVFDLYNLLLAVLLAVTPWLFAYGNEDARIDLSVTGPLIAVIAFATFIAFSKWEECLNLLLGFWLIGSPWVLGFAHTQELSITV